MMRHRLVVKMKMLISMKHLIVDVKLDVIDHYHP
jgi:hypothetical protein